MEICNVEPNFNKRSNNGDKSNESSSKTQSRFIGINFNSKTGGWQGNGTVDGALVYLGYSKSEEECAQMAREKVSKFKAEGHRVANEYGQRRKSKKRQVEF